MDFLTVSFYFGIALLLGCVAILITPLRDRFTGATQEIQGFGLNLKVSVLTLLVLISVGLIGSGVWRQLQNINSQLRDLEKKKADAEAQARRLEQQLVQTQRTDMVVFLHLEGVRDVSALNFTSLKCSYTTSSSDAPLSADVSRGRRLDEIKVLLKDLTRETEIDSLEITDQDKKVTWKKESFRPLQPVYDLTR